MLLTSTTIISRGSPLSDVIEQQVALFVRLERVWEPFTIESVPMSRDNCSRKILWTHCCVTMNSVSTVSDNTRRAEEVSSGAEECLDVLLCHVLGAMSTAASSVTASVLTETPRTPQNKTKLKMTIMPSAVWTALLNNNKSSAKTTTEAAGCDLLTSSNWCSSRRPVHIIQ